MTYLVHGSASGETSLSSATALLLPDVSGGGRVSLGLGDVDADGFGDVLVNGDVSLWVVTGNPTGSVTLSDATASISDPDGHSLGYGAAAADLDGDGAAELLVSDVDSDGYGDALVTAPSESAATSGGGAA